MKMKKLYFLLILLMSFLFGFTQNGFVLENEKSDKIYFKLINNLIIIPVELNGVELSFLLDTGVTKPILFNILNFSNKLEVKNKELIYLRGLGEEQTVEALKSTDNILKIGKTINLHQDIYAINDPDIDFAARLGLPIHGIIGYDFLKNFIVEINYSRKYLKVYNPTEYSRKNCKKCDILKLSFVNNKPYLNAAIIHDNNTIDLNLLVDTGSSDALWLFEDEEKGIRIPTKNFIDFLGRGLSGSIFGKRAKIDELKIGKFTLYDVNAAFPDSIAIAIAKRNTTRNGSLSGNILKRFNVVLDYPNKKLLIQKNRYFSDLFRYNKSGISLEHQGARIIKRIVNSYNIDSYKNVDSKVDFTQTESYKYIFVPAYKIVQIRKDSPADKAGLKVNDIILSINRRDAHTYNLQDLMGIFYGDEGRVVRMLVERNGVQLRYNFTLKSML